MQRLCQASPNVNTKNQQLHSCKRAQPIHILVRLQAGPQYTESKKTLMQVYIHRQTKILRQHDSEHSCLLIGSAYLGNMSGLMANVYRLGDLWRVQVAHSVCGFGPLLQGSLQPHHLPSLAVDQNHMRRVHQIQKV